VTSERIVKESSLLLVGEWPPCPHHRSFSYTDHKINWALVPERVPSRFGLISKFPASRDRGINFSSLNRRGSRVHLRPA
jgi:hypothetical protein